MICWALMPAARQSSTTLTGTRVPAMTAWPLSTAGSVVINPSRSGLMRPVCPCLRTTPAPRARRKHADPFEHHPSMPALRPTNRSDRRRSRDTAGVLDVLEQNRRLPEAGREDEDLEGRRPGDRGLGLQENRRKTGTSPCTVTNRSITTPSEVGVRRRTPAHE